MKSPTRIAPLLLCVLAGCWDEEAPEVPELSMGEGAGESDAGSGAPRAARPGEGVERSAPRTPAEAPASAGQEEPAAPAPPPTPEERMAQMVGTWYPLSGERISTGAESWAFAADGSAAMKRSPDAPESEGSYTCEPGEDLVAVAIRAGERGTQKSWWRLEGEGRATVVRWYLAQSKLDLRVQKSFVRKGSETWKRCEEAARITAGEEISTNPVQLTRGASYILARATPLCTESEMQSGERAARSMPVDARMSILRLHEKDGIPWYEVRVALPEGGSMSGWVSSEALRGQQLDVVR